jgi:hypothetical protein
MVEMGIDDQPQLKPASCGTGWDSSILCLLSQFVSDVHGYAGENAQSCDDKRRRNQRLLYGRNVSLLPPALSR